MGRDWRFVVLVAAEHRRVGHAPLFEARPVSGGWHRRDWRCRLCGSWVYSPFVLLFVIEFVDVVAASLGKSEMKVLAIGVGPVHRIGEKIDEVRVSRRRRSTR